MMIQCQYDELPKPFPSIFSNHDNSFKTHFAPADGTPTGSDMNTVSDY
jgi:hypothetical protein